MSVPDGPVPRWPPPKSGATPSGRGRASGRAPRRAGAPRSWASRRPWLDRGRVDEPDREVGSRKPSLAAASRAATGSAPSPASRPPRARPRARSPALQPLGLRQLGVGDLAQVGAVLGRLPPRLGQLALEHGVDVVVVVVGSSSSRPPGPASWTPMGARLGRRARLLAAGRAGARSWYLLCHGGRHGGGGEPGAIGWTSLDGCRRGLAARRSRIWRTCSGE